MSTSSLRHIIQFLKVKPYPEPIDDGFWGKPTATIDWCEENYVCSPYVAEWSNTITNSLFVILAIHLTIICVRNRLDTRFTLIALGFGLVGLGSWFFHMTLRYGYQLLDELPMVYVTCIPAWSALCEEENKNGGVSDSSLRKRWTAGILVFTAALVLTIIYVCIYPNPLIHQAAYACVTFYVVGCSVRLARKYVKDPRENGNLSKCMGMGAAMFSLAYVLWLLDVHACALWRHLRRDFLLLPLGTLLELHAWWHLLTGMGVYYFIMALIYLRQLLHDRRDEYTIIWRWRVLPEVTHRQKKLWQNYSLEFLGPYIKTPTKSKENSHLKSS